MKHNDSRYIEIGPLTRSTASLDTQRKIANWPEQQSKTGQYQEHYEHAVSFYVVAGTATLALTDGKVIDIQCGDFVRIEQGAEVNWSSAEALNMLYMSHNSYASAANRKAQVYWQ